VIGAARNWPCEMMLLHYGSVRRRCSNARDRSHDADREASGVLDRGPALTGVDEAAHSIGRLDILQR
jgi:hypothetical protein